MIIQIQWTCPHLDEARKVIDLLLEKRLIACATILPQVESHYRWKDVLETSQEVKVYLKTTEELFTNVEKIIQENCSYKVPEIIAFKAYQVSRAYEQWVQAETKPL